MKFIPYIITLVLTLLSHATFVHAQETISNQPKVKLAGLVKTDLFYDTRQTVSAREGHFLLFPAAPVKDAQGKDIQNHPGINFLPIQSILSIGVSEVKIAGADITALIEGDFFGTTNSNIDVLRLRHAYVKMQWPKTEFLAGQFWHPIFATSCYPGTVSFNTGTPIQPFSRTPQIRFSYIPGIFKLSAALLTQRDYGSTGPEGVSSKYLRDSGLPEIQISAELTHKKTNELILGAGFGYKRLTPQLITGKGYKTSETVRGVTANAFVKKVTTYFTIKAYLVYLENGSEFLSISGYAVKDTIDSEKGLVTYTPIKTLSYWGEIHSNGKRIQAGIFAGYSENLGTGCVVKGPYYLMSNMPVKSLYRISPRIILKRGPLSFATEIEYTSATYGYPSGNGEISGPVVVDNVRLLMSVMYKF